jgi:large conductance mechanosensitive channel
MGSGNLSFVALSCQQERIMSMMTEFKEFAIKGNAVDMAVGIIVGAAFGKIVSSFVNDVIMPPIGLLIGGVDFNKLTFTLKEASGDVAAVMISYGKFIQTVIDFTIIAFVIFIVIKAINSQKRKEEEPVPPPGPSKEELLLSDIRDILKEKQ